MCELSDHSLIHTADGRVRQVDACLRALVQYLNDVGIPTRDCCCGHYTRFGHITITAADAERARGLGFRVCIDAGQGHPEFPFFASGETVNIILPYAIRRATRS